jgi:hypothetical protein
LSQSVTSFQFSRAKRIVCGMGEWGQRGSGKSGADGEGNEFGGFHGVSPMRLNCCNGLNAWQGGFIEYRGGYRLIPAADFSAPVALVGDSRKTLQIIFTITKNNFCCLFFALLRCTARIGKKQITGRKREEPANPDQGLPAQLDFNQTFRCVQPSVQH